MRAGYTWVLHFFLISYCCASDILNRVYDNYALHALKLMQSGSRKCSKHKADKACVFEDIIPSLPLSNEIMHLSDGNGDTKKNLLLPSLVYPVSSMNSKPVAYGVGLSTNTQFENSLSDYYEVHGFDCTVPADMEAVFNQNFTFHRICIGMTRGIGRTIYGGVHNQVSLTFKSLNDTMQLLNHTKLSLLKLDVEGAEWSILHDLVTNNPREFLPEQLLFELHTARANPSFVPRAMVMDKHKRQVDNLFLALFAAGYRVVMKEINRWDRACAEFSLLLV